MHPSLEDEEEKKATICELLYEGSKACCQGYWCCACDSCKILIKLSYCRKKPILKHVKKEYPLLVGLNEDNRANDLNSARTIGEILGNISGFYLHPMYYVAGTVTTGIALYIHYLTYLNWSKE